MNKLRYGFHEDMGLFVVILLKCITVSGSSRALVVVSGDGDDGR